MIKAMRAADFNPAKADKIRFPVFAEPKIDGVRGLNMSGIITARTMKKFANKHVTHFFSGEEYVGFDGEFAAEKETHPDLCRLTTSALNTIEGQPFLLWHIFDFVTEETRHMSYRMRHAFGTRRLKELQAAGKCGHLRMVQYRVCNNLQELMAYHEENMELGYEGTCFYDPEVTHKEGKSSPTHKGVLRIKDFIDGEAVVLSVAEGETNNNEAQINELGRQFRSSHKENKSSNGQVGSLECRCLADIYDPYDETKLLIKKDQIITVSPGKMTEAERIDFFRNQKKIVGKIIKFKFFPKGIKDKPRFPVYLMIRPENDVL